MRDRIAPKGVKNRIAQVGIELEGGWGKLPTGYKWDERANRDGSVSLGSPRDMVVNRNTLAQNLLAGTILAMRYIGEIPSPVLAMEEWENWVVAHYPHQVNETCGLHAHMSFKHKLNYQRLMTPEYTAVVVKGLKKWAEAEKLAKDHPLWPRLNDPNHRHCAHAYLGDHQAMVDHKDFNSRGKPHSRYTAINYCAMQHGTVECRLLSMMESPEQAVRGLKEVFFLTNQFLAKMRLREMKVEAKVPITPTTTSHYRIRV